VIRETRLSGEARGLTVRQGKVFAMHAGVTGWSQIQAAIKGLMIPNVSLSP